MNRRIAVVGASLAGLRAAEAIRATGFDGELAIVGEEVHPPYDRPPLSKALLAGVVEPAALTLVPDPELEARWLLGRRATALDRAASEVVLDDGSRISFERLVIATGCSARPWPGAHGAFTLRNVDDALGLRVACSKAHHVAIVGAGFIGCEVAATLRTSGREVTLIDSAPRPMMPLGALAAEACASMHATRGVHMRTGKPVADVTRRSVVLADGERVDADVVLTALGAVPNTDWLDGAGLRLNGGVLTDAFCFADDERRIVAVGDVAVVPHPLADGLPIAIRHWSNAVEQAAIAAGNLLAQDEHDLTRCEPIPTFWSDQYDVKIQSVGFPHLAEHHEWSVEGSLDDLRFVAAGERAGRLIGAVAFNRAGRVAAYRRRLSDDLRTTDPASA